VHEVGRKPQAALLALGLHHEQFFLEARRPSDDRTVGIERKGCAIEYHFVLAADEVRIDHRQVQRPGPLGHARHAFAAFARVKGRCIDHGQHFRARFLGQQARLVEPRVFADQQPDAHALDLEHASALAGDEITPLVEHLVIGQLALGVGLQHPAFAEHAGRVVAPVHGHRFAADVATGGMPHHDVQAF
jgi:hypothetical protein